MSIKVYAHTSILLFCVRTQPVFESESEVVFPDEDFLCFGMDFGDGCIIKSEYQVRGNDCESLGLQPSWSKCTCP